MMGKGRLEAFSDGVFAIIITIMVLDLKVPTGSDIAVLQPLIPVFLSYLLSFVFVGIYWNNHHHLMHLVREVNGGILWANLHLLFWLSLIPFVTRWMGDAHFASVPVALYGVVLLFSGCAYYILARALITHHGQDSSIAKALGRDLKGKISVVVYAFAIPCSFYQSWIACTLYVLVALMWLVPDRRIERTIAAQ